MKPPLPSAPRPLALPKEPFRGIDYFRYIDAPIFFARDDESAKLVRLVTVYRGVLLYGDSGSGKSSLINARFLPDIIAGGFQPERLRVQPRDGEEFIVERVPLTAGNKPPFLPSIFAPEDASESRVVLSVAAFTESVLRAGALESAAHPLLIFDQFEELVTQFEEAPAGREALDAARKVQTQIVDAILQLLRNPMLGVKLLFVFREDYLAKVHRLFARHPDLADRYLRLTSPRVEALGRIIRGPFDEHPGKFGHEISPELAASLDAAIAERCESGRLNLSEVQIACLRLWASPEPEKLFKDRGVAGLLEDYSLDALNRLGEEHRDVAVALLGALVTASGTRNIVSGDDLVARVQNEENCEAAAVKTALDALVTGARLVRRELRHDTPFYEIVSEFLVPWIRRQKAERRVAQERLETERRLEAERLESERKLQEERDAAEKRRIIVKRQQLKKGITVLSIMVVLLVAALGYAWRQAGVADTKAKEAKTAAEEAGKAAEKEKQAAAAATAAKIEAEKQKQAAEAAVEEKEKAILKAKEAGAASDAARGTAERARAAAEKERAAAEEALTALQRQVADISAQLYVQLERPNISQAQKTELLKRNEPLARALAELTGSTQALQQTLNPAKTVDPEDSPSVVLADHTDSIWAAAVSPAGNRIATASADRTVRVWNSAGKVEAILLASTSVGGATCAAFSPNGKFLVTGSAGEAVRVFDVEKQSQVPVPTLHRDTVTAVAYSLDGARILSASADKTVKLWAADNQLSKGRIVLANWLHAGVVSAAAFSADGSMVVSCCDDRVLRTWDPAKRASAGPVKQVRLDAPPRRGVFSPVPGSTLVAAASGRKLVLWDTGKTGPPRVRAGHQGGVIRLAFSPDGKRVATAGADGAAFLWSVEGDSPPVALPVQHRGRVLSIAWAPGFHLVATGGEDGTVELWDVANPQSPKQLKVLRGHTGPVWFATFTADSKQLVTTSATTKDNSDLPSAAGKAAESRADLSEASDRTARLWDMSAFVMKLDEVVLPRPQPKPAEPPPKQCWVKIWHNPGFEGTRQLRFNGTHAEPDLAKVLWPGTGNRIEDDVDSLETGPDAWFIGYDSPGFQRPVVWVGPNERHGQLPDDFKSFRLFDREPPGWGARYKR